MKARRKIRPFPPQDAADELVRAIQALGDYSHVTVRPTRGHLNVYAGNEDPVARLTALGAGLYRLSFHTHTGRWEPMPFMGDTPKIAQTLVTCLAPYLEPDDFPGGKSGSDH
jgi:hypothetical protein